MKRRASRENRRALAAQNADADQITHRPLYRVLSGEAPALVDLTSQLADRELGGVLGENEV